MAPLDATAVTHLPPLGSTHRNPDFWSDVEVRHLVIETHRQMEGEQARAHILAQVGPARTPSKSALNRAWKRLDKVLPAPIAATAPPTLRRGIVHRLPRFWADEAVRALVIAEHRQRSIEQMRTLIAERLGADRVPSRSAIARAWKRLDPSMKRDR